MRHVKHEDVMIGDTVYFDNYENGKYPLASPRVSGPFKKVVGNGCGRCFQNAKGQTCMHYPENLLMEEVTLNELKKAFCDVLDGNYQPYEIQAQTGLTMERCEEISNLFKRLVKS